MKRYSRKIIEWVLILACLLAIFQIGNLFTRREEYLERADDYKIMAQREKSRIMRCVSEDGLILFRPWDSGMQLQEQKVVPYFSTIAAMGLMSGTTTPEQLDAVRGYLLWYLDHLNTWQSDFVNGDGTVYDWHVVRSKGRLSLTCDGDYDSVDSYAALFLILANRYASLADPQPLLERRDDVLRVVNAMLRTVQENDLAVTKKEFPVCYLMDNCEVYAGLRAGISLVRSIAPDAPQLDQMAQAADRLLPALEELLWNPDRGFYEVGVDTSGSILPCEGWEEFYPSSTAQLFPMCFGVLSPDSGRAVRLYSDFSSRWNWEYLSHMTDGESHHFWSVLAYASALRRDELRLNTYMEQYTGLLSQLTPELDYNLHSGDMGWAALACGSMEEYYRTLASHPYRSPA